MNQTKYTSPKNTSFHTKIINNLNCLHLFHRNRESSFSIVWRFEKRKQKTWCDWLKLAITRMDAISGQFQMNDDALFDWMDMDGLQTRSYSCQIWESVHYMHKTPWTNVGIGTCILMNGSIIYLHTSILHYLHIQGVYSYYMAYMAYMNLHKFHYSKTLYIFGGHETDFQWSRASTIQYPTSARDENWPLPAHERPAVSAAGMWMWIYGSIWPSKTLGVIFFSE